MLPGVVDPHERVVILSRERNRTTITRPCSSCGIDIEKGTKVLSIGIVDRKHETRERRYVCLWCEDLYAYDRAEDAPEHVQQFMLENRLTQEVWI